MPTGTNIGAGGTNLLLGELNIMCDTPEAENVSMIMPTQSVAIGGLLKQKTATPVGKELFVTN